MGLRFSAKKKKLLAAVSIITAAVVFIAVFFIGRSIYLAKGIYFEEKWNIDLPDNMKLKFTASVVYIDGSADYAVFICREPPDSLSVHFRSKFTIDKNDFESRLSGALEGLKIPRSELPSFNEKYDCGYLEKSHGIRAAYLYILYYPDSKKLIVCEDIRQYRY